MRSLRRGVALISVMLIAVMMFLLTLTFLIKQRLEQQSISFQVAGAKARALAQAGLEDVLVKMDKDYDFPPPSAVNQTVYSYSEQVSDDSGPVGQYVVEINQQFRSQALQQIVLIKVRGEVGQQPQTMQCATLQAYLDTDATHPTYFQVVQFEWLSGGL